MRLLHIHSGNLYGGVEALLLTLRRFQHLVSLEQDFALCFEGRLVNELREIGAQPVLIGEVKTRNPWTILRARKNLTRLLRERHYDAAICHMPWSQALFGASVRASRTPLIFWMHDIARGRHWLERWAALTKPDRVICNSGHTASTLAHLYRKVPYEIFHAPVELDARPADESWRWAVRASMGTADDAVVIVQASRFEAWKGHRDHIEALGRLRDLAGWECWIAGGAQRPAEQRYLEQLEWRVAELGLDERIRFCGQRSDIPAVLRAADIYCQPNTEPEPFGIIFAEAMAASLPIATTALGGVADLIDESCALIAPPRDPQQLAMMLEQLIQDRALRLRLGEAGASRVKLVCDPGHQLGELMAIVQRAKWSGESEGTTAG